jgi:hypothetical protein
MRNNQLRYYIALGAPPTRRPVTGDESFMRPEIGFNPSWFYKYCSISFGEKWHTDVDYRLECHEIMKEEVKKRFRGVNIGGILDEDPADLLTGLYGTVLVELLYGKKIKYYDDKWPIAKGDLLSDEQMKNLEIPDFDDNEYFQNILEQIDKIEKTTGKVIGFLNWQGVLNNAFRLRGEQIFVDMVINPEETRYLFDCIAETIIKGTKKVQEKQRRTGVDYRFGNIANCTANMVSPHMYNDLVFPYDLKIRKAFRDFAIHNCAWSIDGLIDVYSVITDLGYIDMGMDSDFKKVKKTFPDTRRNILYKSVDVLNKSKEEIYLDFKKIAEELAPCDVGLPDLESDVPDEKILYILELCKEFSYISK